MFSRRGRFILLLLFALVSSLSFIGLSKVRFEFDFEAFLPQDDPEITFYKQFKERFQPGGDAVLVAIPAPDGAAFQPKFLDKVRKFTRCARRLPLVSNAYSLVTIKDYVYDPAFPIQIPVFDYRRSQDLKADSLQIMNDPRFPGNLISYDGTMLVVNISMPIGQSQYNENWFNWALDGLLAEFGFQDAAKIGFPIFHKELLDAQTSEFGFYTVVGILVMLLCMALVFRRFWGTLIAFCSVFLGMIYFFGFLGWVGHPIDLMGTLFPVLLVIVGTSDVIHIMTKYVDELHQGKSKEEALRITMREIGMATFMTSLTTSIGFLTLLTSAMPPIRNFGLLAAVGVFIAFGTVILLTTALVSWFSAEQLMRPQKGKKMFGGFLAWTERVTRLRPRTVAMLCLLFCLVCVLGATNISLNLTSARDFPRNSKVLADFDTVDEKFRGVNSLDMAVELKAEGSLFDLELQQDLQDFENYLNNRGDLGAVASPLAIFKLLNMAWNGPEPKNYRLADSQADFDEQYAHVVKLLSEMLRTVLSEDGRSAWLYARFPDRGSEQVDLVKAEIDDWLRESGLGDRISIRHTGPRHIFDFHQTALVKSLGTSVALAFLFVSLFMAIVFRNVKVVIISLVPNIVPLLATAGLIGFLGLQLDPKVAIVFTVAFGIAVDDSIHFLSRYRLERRKGLSLDEAIVATFEETGAAIILTSLILFFGFASLLGSVFPPTLMIGLLLSLTLLVAMLADFFLIPVLIRWLLKK